MVSGLFFDNPFLFGAAPVLSLFAAIINLALD